MIVIADRVRFLREQKKFSQGEIENRTGLLRCYISRVENGHTIPSVETVEKLARALDLSLYQFLYDGEEPPPRTIPNRPKSDANLWGSTGKDGRFLRKLREYLSRMTQEDRDLLLHFAIMIANKKKHVNGDLAASDSARVR